MLAAWAVKEPDSEMHSPGVKCYNFLTPDVHEWIQCESDSQSQSVTVLRSFLKSLVATLTLASESLPTIVWLGVGGGF